MRVITRSTERMSTREQSAYPDASPAWSWRWPSCRASMKTEQSFAWRRMLSVNSRTLFVTIVSSSRALATTWASSFLARSERSVDAPTSSSMRLAWPSATLSASFSRAICSCCPAAAPPGTTAPPPPGAAAGTAAAADARAGAASLAGMRRKSAEYHMSRRSAWWCAPRARATAEVAGRRTCHEADSWRRSATSGRRASRADGEGAAEESEGSAANSGRRPARNSVAAAESAAETRARTAATMPSTSPLSALSSRRRLRRGASLAATADGLRFTSGWRAAPPKSGERMALSRKRERNSPATVLSIPEFASASASASAPAAALSLSPQ
mmetsp:Transcript_16815/g.65701  ORF Transcript_16815/g.65701 Transcript_16815/m.65701 type:complete len:327 (+) Transcript_16815:1463-2443(+)